jgi:hypothetical protein
MSLYDFTIDGQEFTGREWDILMEQEEADKQLRNFRKMLATCPPKKRKEYERTQLPKLITRATNARLATDKLMRSKGFQPK